MDDYYIEKSNDNKHKYMVSYINEKTGRVNTIRFGSKSDYTQHKILQMKKNYINRYQKNNNWTIVDTDNASFWKRWILYNKVNIHDSIRYTEERFNIKIHFID